MMRANVPVELTAGQSALVALIVITLGVALVMISRIGR